MEFFKHKIRGFVFKRNPIAVGIILVVFSFFLIIGRGEVLAYGEMFAGGG